MNKRVLLWYGLLIEKLFFFFLIVGNTTECSPFKLRINHFIANCSTELERNIFILRKEFKTIIVMELSQKSASRVNT